MTVPLCPRAGLFLRSHGDGNEDDAYKSRLRVFLSWFR